MELRNTLIREWKEINPKPPEFALLYFGIRQGDVVDQRYQSTIDAIYTLNDNVIAFSIMLVESLVAQAKKKRDAYAKQLRGQFPRVNTFDFTDAKPFLPEWDKDLKKFAEMLEQAFPTKKAKFYRRLWSRLRRVQERSESS